MKGTSIVHPCASNVFLSKERFGEISVNRGLLLRIALGGLALYTVGVRFPRTMQKNRRTIHAPLVLCVAHLFHRSACARGVPRSTPTAVSDRRPRHPSARCAYRNLG